MTERQSVVTRRLEDVTAAISLGIVKSGQFSERFLQFVAMIPGQG